MKDTPIIISRLSPEQLTQQRQPVPVTTNIEKKDTTAIFWECQELCMALFKVLGAVGTFINDLIKSDVAALNVRNSAMAVVLESGFTPNDPAKNGTGQGSFGGGGADKLDLANKMMDYFHQFGIGMDIPSGYAKDNSVKLTEADRAAVKDSDLNNWVSSLNNQIDRYKNSSQTQSTQVKGTLDSISSANEMSTAITKSINTMLLAIKL